MSKNYFKIIINFKNKTSLIIPKGKMSINNLMESEDWEELDDNSIANTELSLCRIYDKRKNKTIYIFLKNANIIVLNNIVNIITFKSKKIYYEAIKRNRYTKEINELSQQIKKQKLLKNIGLNINEYIKMEELEEELFILKQKQEYNLTEMEEYE
ncbi:MSC_0621 family F1-like ATPase epsilon subunit [Mycoplasma elephantis]|uniref:MSC_0621 family F1-like ATPase epsilon subunit n=1 Tax=Mycoplasma elephantis TaxID=114882 RepID=UPI000482AC1C|nr:hypothetical protein [Mycoplasma elephantis]